MRGESMKDKSKKSTYSTTFGVDPILLRQTMLLILGGGSRLSNNKTSKILIIYSHLILVAAVAEMVEVAGVEPAS